MVYLAAVTLALFAQQHATGPSQAELDAMKKLDFLVGSWKGTGSMMEGPGKNQAYTGSESVQRKLQGKALLVEGLFTGTDSKAVVHETLAVITYDAAAKKYRFQTHLFNQPSAEHELHVVDNGFWWELKPSPGVTVKFTMKLTDKGEWNEIGEVTVPGRSPMKILEMTLAKSK